MSENDAWQRRHAIQIVAALPDTIDDALLVLDLARQLVEQFLVQPPVAELGRDRVRGAVVSLSSATKGSNR
jgi:hypothetical protein